MGRRIILSFLILITLFIKPAFLSANEDLKTKGPSPQLLFFYSQSCHACQKTKQDVMPSIEKAFFDKVIIEYLDIGDIENYKLLISFEEKYGYKPKGLVPAVIIGNKVLVGYDQIKKGIRDSINDFLTQERAIDLAKFPSINLTKHFLSFGIWAIIFAGLVDGVNPCAFTVLIFFVSFLFTQGYRRRELIVVGLSFILSVFLTYVFIGLGIFRFLYSLRNFYILTKAIYYLIAGFCFVLAGFAVYDFLYFKKTSKTEGLTLQLPKIIKDKIHAIIGSQYRVAPEQRTRQAQKRYFLSLVFGAFVVGFFISLLEAVCTGQMYLPTITFVLKNPALRMRALLYLLLYNFMFIVPLMIILIAAVLDTTSQKFASLANKHMLTIKLLMALVFIIFGILMLVGA